MKRVKGKNFSVQFTPEEIEKVKMEFYDRVEKLLAIRYSVNLPLFAIKYLAESYAQEVKTFDYFLNLGGAISGREGVETEMKERILGLIAEDLTKQGIDGYKFIKDILDNTKP